jgi:predicted DNA-binding transcriptional regulator YafY
VQHSYRRAIIDAIQRKRKVQLGYQRRDGSPSLHVVAPIDLQLGDTEATATTEYLWAYCFAEEKAEMHRMNRVLTVRIIDERFDLEEILAKWPTNWPLPKSWRVPRPP